MSSRLTAAEARTIVDAAIAKTAADGVPMSVAVTDPGGATIVLVRMDRAPPATADVAVAKARSSAGFYIPTSMLAGGVQAMPGLATVPHIVGAGGGMPVMRNGVCVGAVGASGGSAEQDEEASKAGIAALAP